MNREDAIVEKSLLDVTSISRRYDPGSLRLLLLLLAVLASGVLSMRLGHYPVSSAAVFDVFWSAITGTPSAQPQAVCNVILAVRLPRVLSAILVGASLAASGAAYQTLFRNPLASPAILGVSAGASLGAALAMLLYGSVLAIQGSAFAGGIVAVCMVILIADRLGKGSTLVLVLSGLVVSALFQSLTSALKYVADPTDRLPAIVFWLLGGLGRVSMRDLAWSGPFALTGMAALFLLRWPTQVIEAGDDEANTLGVPVSALRFILIVAATLMTAAATSISGIVGWVGLLVPHLARLLVGPAYVDLLPASVLLGAGYLLLVDDFCRSAFSIELPLGIVTAVLGAPIFVVVLAKARRQWC